MLCRPPLVALITTLMTEIIICKCSKVWKIPLSSYTQCAITHGTWTEFNIKFLSVVGCMSTVSCSGNIALNKPAYQSSTYKEAVASQAVDGDR